MYNDVTVLFWSLITEHSSFVVLISVAVSCALIETITPAKDSPRRVDRWPTNVALTMMNVIVASTVPVSALWAAEAARDWKIGLFNIVGSPWRLNALGTFAVLSFATYVQHIISHKIPTLWRIHRVHHIDVHLDVSTSGRHHPLEVAFGIAFLLPIIFVFGLMPEAVTAYAVLALISSTVSHANVFLPERLDNVIRLLLVTPNMHSVHHSASHRETDSNYGDVFSIWDKIFGTYNIRSHEQHQRMVTGLKEVQDDRAHDLWWQLKSPFLRSIREGGRAVVENQAQGVGKVTLPPRADDSGRESETSAS